MGTPATSMYLQTAMGQCDRFEGIFGFVCAGFQKVPLSTFYILVLFFSFFCPKHPLLEVFLLIKHPTHVKNRIWPKKMENLVKNTFVIWVWKSLNDWAAQNNYLKKKKLHLKILYCCEAHRSMLFNYLCKKPVLRGTFGEIWRIQIQIYPKTYVELKYGACYLKNKVSAHSLGLVVQLSWRVAPPSHSFFLDMEDLPYCDICYV